VFTTVLGRLLLSTIFVGIFAGAASQNANSTAI
jgi:hypothetical protein